MLKHVGLPVCLFLLVSGNPVSCTTMGGLDLSEIDTGDLVREVQRRLECLSKPEKRLILIGAW